MLSWDSLFPRHCVDQVGLDSRWLLFNEPYVVFLDSVHIVDDYKVVPMKKHDRVGWF